MSGVDGSQLGRETEYPQTYQPSVLYPVPRAEQRRALGLAAEGLLPFTGTDRWQAYEISWLDGQGIPQYALGEIDVPADSPALIESKSLKLYLNSMNMTRFDTMDRVRTVMEADLSECCGAPVTCRLWHPADTPARWGLPDFMATGDCLDDASARIDGYRVAPERLRLVEKHETSEGGWLYSYLLRSNCPVTGQPDWGTLAVRLEGPQIDRTGLLAYIVSYRSHTGFHEHCVERIFHDIQSLGEFRRLDVWALYTRRGGLAINPWRSLEQTSPPPGRLPWQ